MTTGPHPPGCRPAHQRRPTHHRRTQYRSTEPQHSEEYRP